MTTSYSQLLTLERLSDTELRICGTNQIASNLSDFGVYLGSQIGTGEDAIIGQEIFSITPAAVPEIVQNDITINGELMRFEEFAEFIVLEHDIPADGNVVLDGCITLNYSDGVLASVGTDIPIGFGGFVFEDTQPTIATIVLQGEISDTANPTVEPTSIPTLSQWGMIFLILMLTIICVNHMKPGFRILKSRSMT